MFCLVEVLRRSPCKMFCLVEVLHRNPCKMFRFVEVLRRSSCKMFRFVEALLQLGFVYCLHLLLKSSVIIVSKQNLLEYFYYILYIRAAEMGLLYYANR